ncbi:golgin subfamily A member 1-like [Mya arenaria]|uniref:golgin subfamily A member 1-like n=1 Tax=Mya arenaria TaxID=6604 RepID=UPI0022DF58F8|nr:golgin subfamily A member 1-like [Mya arenaria]
MFAKLKEKIQKEGGGVAQDGPGLSTIPGHASPRKPSLTAQSPGIKDESLFSSKDDLTKIEESSREELVSALQKRNEQSKKLEARLNEYSSGMKDSNKKIEKLEAYIEKQQEMLAKRTQELNEQHQASRVLMLDKHKLELEQKHKEVEQLQARLQEAEGVKERCFKEEEELQEYTTQEMAKLKHMVILKEEEVTKCQKELSEKFSLLETERERTKQLEATQERLKALEAVKSNFESECSSHGKIVSGLTRERMELEEKLANLKTTFTEKSSQISSLESKYTDLESEHQTLIRNSELQKNKLNQQLTEKRDLVEQLEEQVKLLQQREHDQTLSGDDKTLAVQKQRDVLEKKLSETREQLTQIKSSWSDKISMLEDQISHLNMKIAEDAEELTEAQNHTQAVRGKLTQEIESLKEKVRAAEKKAEANLDLVSEREAQFKKERLDLETQVSKVKLQKVDLDTHLRAKLASVESQLMSLEMEKSQESTSLHEQLAKVQKQLKETEKRLENMKQEKETVEKEKATLQASVSELERRCDALQDDLLSKEKHSAELASHRQLLLDELKITQEKLEKAHESSKSKSSELAESNKDKDEYMMRNAELSQQLRTLQQTSGDERRALEEEKAGLEKELVQKSELCTQLEAKVSCLQAEHNDLNSAEVEELAQTVTTLEEQLAEKNKTLKKQEQKINDLKKTLQRELKVQSLPNDEPIDPNVAALTPPLGRKNSFKHEHSTRTRKHSQHDRSPIPGEGLTESTNSPNVSFGQQDFFLGQSFTPGKPGSHGHSYGANSNSSYHATISVNEAQNSSNIQSAYSVHKGNVPTPRREFDMRHLEKDINFQYLKHVVMKFMLSREHEAIQLIKAVSLLLRFSPEEQKLIRDTLEWKMSWFGGSQPPAVIRGQTSKIVPPSY